MKAYDKTSNAVKMNLSRGIKKIATILWLLENHHQRIDFGIKDKYGRTPLEEAKIQRVADLTEKNLLETLF